MTSSEFRNNIITYRPWKKYNNILSNNFRKLKRIVVIFAKEHQQSKEKLTNSATKVHLS